MVIAYCLALLVACQAPGPSATPTLNPVSPSPSPQQIIASPTTNLITLHGPGVPPEVVADIAAALRDSAPSVCAALGIPCDFPVAVEVFPDQAAFDQGVMNPAMRGFFALSGDGRIQMVSPANSGRAELSYDDGVGVAGHEFVHLALDHINPDLPDWLDEGTAVLLGPHAVYDRACREQLSGVPLPSLVDLRDHYADVPAADLFAYTLVASIVATDELDGLNALLRAPDEFDQALGRSATDVEQAWWEFMQGGCAGS